MELDYQIFSSIQASSRRVNEGASPAGIVRSARSLMGFASLGGIQEDEIFFSRGEKNIFNTPKKCGCNDSVPNLCSLSVFVAQTPFLLAAEFRGFSFD